MRFSSILIACLVAACGGSTSNTDLFGSPEGGTSDGGSSSDGGSGSDGGGNKDGGPVGDSGLTCNQLSDQLNQLRDKATSCVASSVNVCGVQVPDLCCPITVSSQDSPDVKAFEAALDAFKAQCGPVNCPAMPCQQQPSKKCVAGHCAQQ